MKNYTTDFEYRQVHSKEILSDPLYQRDIDVRRVKAMTKEFDWNLVNAPKLSYRDGRYYVFDGQHTVALLKALNKGHDLFIQCKVYYGLTRLDEMELFLKQNGKARQVNVYDRFRALYKNGDPEITSMVEACESSGLKVWFGSQHADNRIIALRTLYNAYKELGLADFSDMLTLIKQTWGGVKTSLNREMLSAMTLFYKTYGGQFDRKRFAKRLQSKDPVAIVREGRSSISGFAVGCARVIVRAYNGKASPKTQLEERL